MYDIKLKKYNHRKYVVGFLSEKQVSPFSLLISPSLPPSLPPNNKFCHIWSCIINSLKNICWHTKADTLIFRSFLAIACSRHSATSFPTWKTFCIPYISEKMGRKTEREREEVSGERNPSFSCHIWITQS